MELVFTAKGAGVWIGLDRKRSKREQKHCVFGFDALKAVFGGGAGVEDLNWEKESGVRIGLDRKRSKREQKHCVF